MSPISPEEVVAVSLVDGMSEVMGMLSVLVDKDGMKGVLEGMVNIVVSSGPVGTGPVPVGGGPEGLVPGPAVGRSDGLGVGVVTTKSIGPLPVGREVELLLHLQNFFLGKHFSAGLSSGLSGVGTGPNVTSTSTVASP